MCRKVLCMDRLSDCLRQVLLKTIHVVWTHNNLTSGSRVVEAKWHPCFLSIFPHNQTPTNFWPIPQNFEHTLLRKNSAWALGQQEAVETLLQIQQHNFHYAPKSKRDNFAVSDKLCCVFDQVRQAEWYCLICTHVLSYCKQRWETFDSNRFRWLWCNYWCISFVLMFKKV